MASCTDRPRHETGWGTCRPAVIGQFRSHLAAASSILDLGCAAGGYTHYLAAAGYRVTGLDRRLPDLSPSSGSWVQADATKLPFCDHSFDHCLAINVLEHVNDAESLKEIRRVIRGNLCGVVPAAETNSSISDFNLTYHAYIDPTHQRYYTLDSMEQRLTECGFRIIELRYTNPANVVGAALNAFRLPVGLSERLGNLFNRGPFLKKSFTTISFVAASNS